MRLALPLLLFAVLVLAAYRPAPAAPDRPVAGADTTGWQNLQVLPDTLTRDELTAIMRGFNAALGVRCNFCHVREGEDFVFPLDDKPEKEIARGMIRMTWQINVEILPAIAALDEAEGLRVTCWTCHRGEAHPTAPPPPEEEPEEQHEHDEDHPHDHGHDD